jgi:hypothetical protein
MHASITLTRVMSAVRASMRDTANAGFCHACGRKTKPGRFVEPDAEHYPCAFTSCGKAEVFGAEQTLLMFPGV